MSKSNEIAILRCYKEIRVLKRKLAKSTDVIPNEDLADQLEGWEKRLEILRKFQDIN